MNNFFAILTSIIFSFSFSMRSSKDIDNKFDYELKTRIEKDKVFYIDVEKERENGLYFTNSELMLQKEWNYFLLRGKSIDIESRNIDIKELNFLGKYKHSYLGIACLWQNSVPTQALKFGFEYTKKINLFLSQPELSVKAFTLTSDFKHFDKELSGKVLFNLFTFGKIVDFDFFMKANLYQYKSLDWQYKTGLEIKF